MSYDVGHRRGSDLALLRCRPVATAPIRPLAWDSPYATEAALEKAKETKKKKKKKKKSSIVTAVAWIQSVAQELPYASGAAI